MDMFTHLLITYLLTHSIENEYIVLFGVLMAIAPDFDIILSPLGSKFRWALHHGPSHSIVFILAFVSLSSIFVSYLFNLNLLLLIITGLIGGLGHLACDMLTSWSVPLFLPFSKREYKYEIDRAVNPYLMAISFTIIVFLYYLRSIRYNYEIFKLLLVLITIAFISYFLIRLVSKRYSLE